MEELIEKGKLAKSASRVLGSLSASVKNNACRFVNDVLQKRLKEFTEIDKRVDVVNGSFPIKRTHREFIVVTVMHL